MQTGSWDRKIHKTLPEDSNGIPSPRVQKLKKRNGYACLLLVCLGYLSGLPWLSFWSALVIFLVCLGYLSVCLGYLSVPFLLFFKCGGGSEFCFLL
jgi:hypothetical protein